MPNVSALSFDGVNDNASVPNNAVLYPTGVMTLEWWLKIANYNVDYILFVTGDDGQGGKPYKVAINFNNLIFSDVLSFAGRSASVSVSGVSVNVNHHFACVRDASRNLQMYLDGATLGSNQALTGAAPGTNTQGLSIASNQGGGAWTAGTMDEIRLWNVARSGAEIAAYKDIKAAGTETGLVACWHLDTNTGTTDTDVTSNALVLTLSGAAWVTSGLPTLSDPAGAWVPFKQDRQLAAWRGF